MAESYSKGDYSSLPTNDSNLETLFVDPDDYDSVASDDDDYVALGVFDVVGVYLFKKSNTNNTDSINVTCKPKSSLAPLESTVLLQVYNRTLSQWLTVDSNGAAAADTEFTLTASLTESLTDFYDGSYWVAFRVVQGASGYDMPAFETVDMGILETPDTGVIR